MATETTWTPVFSGRLPGFGSSKIPGGRGIKVAYGKFTIGTSEYPDGGYVAADLEALCGFTRIETILPCGYWTNGSHENAFGASWDGTARTLQVMANRAQDGNALTVGTGQTSSELATNNSSADGAIVWAFVFGI